MICLVVSDHGHHTFLYRHIKYNREGGGKEQTNKHGLGLAPSARRGKSVGQLLCSSLCICRLSRACILHETSTKPLGMLTHLFALVNLASVGQQVFAVVFLTSVETLFSALLTSPHYLLLFSAALLCQLLSLSSFWPPFLPPLPVSREISPLGSLCWFRAKTKRSSE